MRTLARFTRLRKGMLEPDDRLVFAMSYPHETGLTNGRAAGLLSLLSEKELKLGRKPRSTGSLDAVTKPYREFESTSLRHTV